MESSDRWTTCSQGHRHWGANGAAGLLLRHHGTDGTLRFLLQHRSPHVHHGDTWGLPGGAIHDGETPLEAALRETREETGGLPAGIVVQRIVVDDHGGWAYHTVCGDVPDTTFVSASTDEQQGTRWVTLDGMTELSLHQGFAASLPIVIGLSDAASNDAP